MKSSFLSIVKNCNIIICFKLPIVSFKMLVNCFEILYNCSLVFSNCHSTTIKVSDMYNSTGSNSPPELRVSLKFT